MSHFSLPRRPIVGLAVLLGAACTGSIDGAGLGSGPDLPGAGGNGSGAQGGSGAGAAGGGDPGKPPPVVAFACKDQGGTIELGPTPMRRLAHAEYDATIAALLGDNSGPSRDFTKDPSLLGYDNNLNTLQVGPTNATEYFKAADALALRASTNLATLLPCQTQDEACAGQFIDVFGKRAYRRPLDAEEKSILLAVYRATRTGGDSFQAGITDVLSAILQSPQFLYRMEFGTGAATGDAIKLTDYEIASRLSYLVTGSMPDDALMAEATAGRLNTVDQVVAQAQRLLGAAAGKRGVARFTEQWIPAASVTPDAAMLQKSTATYADWKPEYPGYLRDELTKFIDHVTWTAGGQLETFLTAPYTFWNRNLNSYYRGSDAAARNSDALVQVQQDPTRYAGFLTKGGFLALEAKPNRSAPVARGIFVREQILCGVVPEAPNDNQIDQAKQQLETASAMQSQKQKLETLVNAGGATCINCHQLMNPLGLALENFDGIGRWRTTDNGQTIDPSGEIVGGTSIDGAFSDHIDMIRRIAGSAEARTCFTKQVFRFSAGRAESAADACTLAAIDGNGQATGYDVRQMIMGVIASEGFLYRHRVQ